MKTFDYVLLFFCLCLLVHCTPSYGMEQDKQQHFAISAMMASTATVAFEGRTEHSIAYGTATSFVIGVAKELYDKAHPRNHTASGGDLVADLTGAVMGAWLGQGMYIVVQRNGASVGMTLDF